VSWLALFGYSTLAATLLPGGSEIVLAGMLIEQPESAFWLWLVATLGNTLGACVTFFMGTLLALKLKPLTLARQSHSQTHTQSEFQGNKEPQRTILQNIRHRLTHQFNLSANRTDQLNRHGAWLLLLSWVPFVGDGFCLAAGYLGWPKKLSLSLIALGKAVRYGLLWLWLV
jgi:membrane protein YqaA with SNARE-associated domain